MGFFRQEYWSWLPCPPPGDLPDPRIKPGSPGLQADSLPAEPPGKPLKVCISIYNLFLISLYFLIAFANSPQQSVEKRQSLSQRQNKIAFLFLDFKKTRSYQFRVLLCSSSPFQHSWFAAASMFVVTGRRKRRNRKVQKSWASSVQFGHSVMSDSLQAHGLQLSRPPYPSPTLRVYSDLCPLSTVMPSNHFILCHPLLLPTSIFPIIRVVSKESVLHIRWPNIGVSASTSDLPMNIQDWLTLELTNWISCSPRDSQESSPKP